MFVVEKSKNKFLDRTMLELVQIGCTKVRFIF